LRRDVAVGKVNYNFAAKLPAPAGIDGARLIPRSKALWEQSWWISATVIGAFQPQTKPTVSGSISISEKSSSARQ
jgi:hypothetical protein